MNHSSKLQAFRFSFAAVLIAGSPSLPVSAEPAAPIPAAPAPASTAVPAHPANWVPPVLTPEQEAATFQLPPGYHMELVMSEPVVKEPVWCSFDGNGRMYVLEMRSYMQDADGSDEFAPISRVSRHESTREDGVYDRHTVFVDHLVLPRTILTLDKGKVIVGRTNTNDLTLYHDSGDTGVSDSSELYYKGGPFTGNLEHQPSGLIWSIDNWIYTTYNSYRLRWRPGAPPLREPTANNGGQWGLTQDDVGKLWFSTAGGEKVLLNFQTHILYAAVQSARQWDPGFPEVWPAVGLADFQGGTLRVREPDKTLNHATGVAGEEVYRGDRLPSDIRGDIFIGEPVGRLVRRAVVEVKDGITTVRNPYQASHSEFLRSTDPYFRPVQVANGPDGCLYIVDMYRGIIQEGNWVKPDSYLRPVVLAHRLDKNIGHGRIWRLVYDGMKPSTPAHLLDMSASELVAELGHPNGWRRDTAQRLLVLKGDPKVAPRLREMALGDPNFFGRLHALWTLEGLGLADAALDATLLSDPDPRLRAAAIRVSESLFKAGDISLRARVMALSNDPDPTVALQAMMTARLLQWPEWKPTLEGAVKTTASVGVREIGTELLKPADRFEVKARTVAEVQQLRQGQAIYDSLCFACHGKDGRGTPIGDAPDAPKLAPSLVDSRIAKGPPQEIVQVLLHGLTGPEGTKTYAGQMIAMGENSDEWIAAVASFVRSSLAGGFPNDGAFGFHASAGGKVVPSGDIVTAQEVHRWRTAFSARKDPWTREQLIAAVLPPTLPHPERWVAVAGTADKPRSGSIPLATDGSLNFSTGSPQVPGQWFQVQLPEASTVAGLRLDSGDEAGAFPRAFKVEVSLDGKSWQQRIKSTRGNGVVTWAHFTPVKARYIRITLTGAGSDGWQWSIRRLEVFPETWATEAPKKAGAPPKVAVARPSST